MGQYTGRQVEEDPNYIDEDDRYIEWLKDNKDEMIKEFIEIYESEFIEYCKDCYNQYGEK